MSGRAGTVLVTGASGLIGRHALAPLARLGFAVHATARHPPEDKAGAEWHRTDLLDPKDRALVIDAVRPTHLLHLAWASGPGTVWQDPANRDWTAASLDLAQRFLSAGGRRWVGVGTCAEYDWSVEALARPAREETTPRHPKTLYGQEKNRLFQYFMELFDGSTGTFAWARLFHLHGPGEDPRRLISYVITRLQLGLPAECSDGAQVRDLIYAGDAGDGLARLVASDVRGAINIGSGSRVTLAEAIREIGRQMGRPDLIRLGARPRPPDDPPILVPDLTRQANELGWRAPTTLADGLALTRGWWIANPPK